MELKDEFLKKAITEEIEENLKYIDDGKHEEHKLSCGVFSIISYHKGKIKLEGVEVSQAECETCRDEDGIPYCLWG